MDHEELYDNYLLLRERKKVDDSGPSDSFHTNNNSSIYIIIKL